MPRGLGADADAAAVKTHHHLLKTLTWFAQEIHRRNLRILEDEFRCSGSEDAHLLLDLADGEPFGVLQIDDEIDNPFVTDARVRGAGQDAITGHIPIRDEPLGAVDDVLVTLQHGAAGKRCRVGARSRFRQGVTAFHFAAGDGRKVFLLLLFRSENCSLGSHRESC